jgi:hypothetical protein
MAYEYVKRYYNVPAEPGTRVTLNEPGCKAKDGVIVRKSCYDSHVHVRFDGTKFDVPCHPQGLIYHPRVPGPPQPPRTNEHAVA